MNQATEILWPQPLAADIPKSLIARVVEILQSLMTHSAITFTLKATSQSQTLAISLKKDLDFTFFCFIPSSFWEPSLNLNITELDNRNNINLIILI